VPPWLLDLFARYGYAVIFVGVFLENMGLPVPGETVLLAGGALAHLGSLSIEWVVATAIVAAILGDNLGFFIGRRGGRALAERQGWRVGLTRARLAVFDQFFLRYGPATVFIARFVTGLRVLCAVLAGTSELSWPTFLFYNATGAVVWSTTVAAAGYALAQSWEQLDRWISRAGLLALVAVGALVVIGALRARRRQAS
ncbi:MAG: DedA family protein, partial [Acidobacteria bacterium]|nr:DedA family protein [Acidobacteriota bacterium]